MTEAPFNRWCRGWAVLAGLWGLVSAERAEAWELELPTDNRAIFSDDPSRFYMYTDRNFEGVQSKPWTAGQYGFVRDQKRTAEGILFLKFHEGMDIRPVLRDRAGEPLDLVRAISAGRVVHVSSVASRSSYGKYVVVRHDWPEGPFFSLYAHLREAIVKPGDKVTAQSVLGGLGYTGDGINRERAHLHVELNLLLSERFERWHGSRFRTANHHGNYNGLNLVGIDLGRLYRERQGDPGLDLPGFFAGEKVHHKVRVPYRGKMPLAERYPFLVKGGAVPGQASWEIHFNASGVPLALVPSATACDGAKVTWVERSETYHAYKTRGHLTGSGATAGLSDSGLSYLDLVTGRF